MTRIALPLAALTMAASPLAAAEVTVTAQGPIVELSVTETVKGRVNARLQRPEGAVYKPPPGYKGNPDDFKRQCYIPWEVVVDAQGNLLSWKIDRCGDELLDQAAEQAIRAAAPFPPAPGGSGNYTIYGTAIFIK
ncbi:MAG: hypothetical protein B7X57_02890 [Erythrobacter sp. 34-65-8]|nr:MAG: hypothetical protein B7X57_02890 [Erythrobacter sp. 34-65-8]